uniref:Uncharacterized protein n=2 Tax=Corethron hystrix TaxID=216773 RepID=A0A7S1B6L2_9STRA|mmetsp:Transcript_14918/g.33143  ORF Transcript_14918/g.33143 Transcript_14918/m.33143 type:complete len:458 (+) Transcript_14918:1743-3116(+)
MGKRRATFARAAGVACFLADLSREAGVELDRASLGQAVAAAVAPREKGGSGLIVPEAYLRELTREEDKPISLLTPPPPPASASPGAVPASAHATVSARILYVDPPRTSARKGGGILPGRAHLVLNVSPPLLPCANGTGPHNPSPGDPTGRLDKARLVAAAQIALEGAVAALSKAAHVLATQPLPPTASVATVQPRSPPVEVGPSRNQRTFKLRPPPPPNAGRGRLARVDRYEGTVFASPDYRAFLETGGSGGTASAKKDAAKSGEPTEGEEEKPEEEEKDQVAAIVRYLKEKREEQRARQVAKAAARMAKAPGGGSVRLLDKGKTSSSSRAKARKSKDPGRRNRGSSAQGARPSDATNSKRRTKEAKERKKKKDREKTASSLQRRERESSQRRGAGRAAGHAKGGPAPRKEGLSFSAALKRGVSTGSKGSNSGGEVRIAAKEGGGNTPATTTAAPKT